MELSNLSPADAGQYRAVAATYSPLACIGDSRSATLSVGSCLCAPGDMDGDDDFDLADLALFTACFGPARGSSPECACANVDGDANGDVNAVDWVQLVPVVAGPLP